MTRSLRKRHLFIWRMLAFILPAGIIIAWLSVPGQIPQTLLQPEPGDILPVVLNIAEDSQYRVSIRSDADTSKLQLEWINKIRLEYPTAFIYKSNKKGSIKDAQLIGRIEGRGNWHFPLDSNFKKGPDPVYLVVYDFIHQQVIDTIKLPL